MEAGFQVYEGPRAHSAHRPLPGFGLLLNARAALNVPDYTKQYTKNRYFLGLQIDSLPLAYCSNMPYTRVHARRQLRAPLRTRAGVS